MLGMTSAAAAQSSEWGGAAGMAYNQNNAGGNARQLSAIQGAYSSGRAAQVRMAAGSTVGRALGGAAALLLGAGLIIWAVDGEASGPWGAGLRMAGELAAVSLGTIAVIALWALAFGYTFNIPVLSDVWRVAVGREPQLGVIK